MKLFMWGGVNVRLNDFYFNCVPPHLTKIRIKNQNLSHGVTSQVLIKIELYNFIVLENKHKILILQYLLVHPKAQKE